MVLTTQQLDNVLASFLNRLEASAFYDQLRLFRFLYDYGFRIRELEKCHHWIDHGNGMIECLTTKKSNNRFLSTTDIHPTILYSIETGTNFFWSGSYTTYRRSIERFMTGGRLKINNKCIGSHAFRHHRIKRHYETTQDIEVTANYFGLKSQLVALNYVNSQIELHPF